MIMSLSRNVNCESVTYPSFKLEEFRARGVRKVTTAITGLWQLSIHRDVAFLSFDVGSSYIAKQNSPSDGLFTHVTIGFRAPN